MRERPQSRSDALRVVTAALLSAGVASMAAGKRAARDDEDDYVEVSL